MKVTTILGIVIIVLTAIIGVGFQTIPPNCADSGQLVTNTLVNRLNGTITTQTFVYGLPCNPYPVFYSVVYPLEFIIAIIIGTAIILLGVIRRR